MRAKLVLKFEASLDTPNKLLKDGGKEEQVDQKRLHRILLNLFERMTRFQLLVERVPEEKEPFIHNERAFYYQTTESVKEILSSERMLKI